MNGKITKNIWKYFIAIAHEFKKVKSGYTYTKFVLKDKFNNVRYIATVYSNKLVYISDFHDLQSVIPYNKKLSVKFIEKILQNK